MEEKEEWAGKKKSCDLYQWDSFMARIFSKCWSKTLRDQLNALPLFIKYTYLFSLYSYCGWWDTTYHLPLYLGCFEMS